MVSLMWAQVVRRGARSFGYVNLSWPHCGGQKWPNPVDGMIARKGAVAWNDGLAVEMKN